MKNSVFFTKKYLVNILSVVAGILLTFAFAPARIYPLAILMPALIFMFWQNVSPRIAFKRGWLFGLGLFGAGVYWVFISIHTFGDASIFLAGLITIGLIAILAIFPALTGYFLNRYFPYNSRSRIFFAFPAIWVFMEWVRSWIFTGFPWLLLGYTQINSPLKGYAAILGVYGISLLVLFSSSLLIQTVTAIRQKNVKHALYFGFIFIAIWAVGAYLNTKTWTQPVGKPIKVSLVQGNIPQQMKWSAEYVQSTLDTYAKLSEPHWDSNIIIWPESAVTIPLQNAEDFLNDMDVTAKKHHATFITGIPVQVPDTQNYYNAVITLGNGKGYYLKHRLVPFGEYTPFHEWVGKLLDILKIPMSDFIPSTEKSDPILANGIKIATFICYEIAFPEMVLDQDPQINLLLTVSNDAWFGHSIAQAQHLEMAQMRAAENGRPVLFVSNNGITAIIDATGKIKVAAPPYVPYVLTDTVQPVQGKTPWQNRGMDPVLFFMVMLILYAVREQRRIKKNKK